MKILGLIKENSGSSYHRILLPFKGLEASFTTQLTNELVEKCEYLVINRSCNISTGTLGLWRKMYGTKIIYDLDDSLEFPPYYSDRGKFIKTIPTIKHKITNSDLVLTTTKALYDEIKDLNPNTHIVPNRISYGRGQFQIKDEDFESFMKRKVKVGIIGSFYHYHDWKEIKGFLHKIALSNEVEFCLGGYDKSAHSYWQEFMFGKTQIYQAQPVDSYIKLYNEFDIILCPLRNDHFNECKSSLKLMEAACSKSVCVADELYLNKDDYKFNQSGHVLSREQKWYNTTMDIATNKEKLWMLKEKTSNFSQRLSFDLEVAKRKELLEGIKSSKNTNLNIYSIKYKEEQPVEYIEYFNKINSKENKSYLFEYNVITNIDVNTDEWTGVFSWKFPLKTGLSRKVVEKILSEKSNFDCVNFCRPINNYLNFTEKHHPGFKQLFNPLCRDLGLPFTEPNNTIYSNFFVLKGKLYKEYQEMIKSAIQLLESPKYRSHVWRDANYQAGLPKEELVKYTGLNYYPFHTFLLERLIGQWIDKNKIRIYNVWNKK